MTDATRRSWIRNLNLRNQIKLNSNQLKFLKIYQFSESYSVSLVDNQEFEITKGYGTTLVEALNDMHENLI